MPLPRRSSAWMFLIVCTSACLPRERFNKQCEWTEGRAVRLDLRQRTGQDHLTEDAQLAEELATRYADFKHGEPFGYEGHGGLLEGGKIANDCLAKLDRIIESTHGVTHHQVTEARRRRDFQFDLAVALSFAVLYLFGAAWTCRRIAHRFAENGPVFWWVTTCLCSVAASLAGVQLLGLWATTAEMLRVGNDHLGRRGQLIPWTQHFEALLACGVVVFLAIALRERITSTGEAHFREAASSRGIALR